VLCELLELGFSTLSGWAPILLTEAWRCLPQVTRAAEVEESKLIQVIWGD
jgi:hypothetical protein